MHRRYRKVSIAMWDDPTFQSMSDEGKLMFNYLLTGRETTNIPGVILAGEATLAEALGWPTAKASRSLREAFAKGLAKGDQRARLIWLPKGIRHNEPESPNVVKSWAKTWPLLPESDLNAEIFHTLREGCERLSIGFREAFAKAFANLSPTFREPSLIQEQEQQPEQQQQQDQESSAPSASPNGVGPSPQQVIGLWNDVCGSKGFKRASKLTPERIRKIKARIAAAEKNEPRDIGWWRSLFTCLAEGKASRGENDRGWMATFDFAIDSEKNVVKTLEGNYAEPWGKQANGPTTNTKQKLIGDGGWKL